MASPLVPPTSLAAANVLWGIAAPLARVLTPQADSKTQEELLEFDYAPGPPPKIEYLPETIDSGVTKGNRLFNEFVVRPKVTFSYGFLTAAEAIKWGKLWNYHMAKFEIYMRPHNDATLTIEWQVVPTPGTRFDLGYLADKYIGHSLELSFSAVEVQSNIPLQTSAIRTRPAHS